MKKLIFVFMLVICITLTCCKQSTDSQKPGNINDVTNISSVNYEVFSENGNDEIIGQDGTEYIYVCNEGFLELLGRKQLIGKISGEDDSEPYGFDIGLYACEQDKDRIMLLRYMPDNEWGALYRKKSASMLDITGKDLIRLEFVGYQEESDEYMYSVGSEHINCGEGITGKENVTSFFKDIKAGKTAESAGLYDLITDEDGEFRNCYELGTVYGFFPGENAAAIPYHVTSFDDQYYSIYIDYVEYVLPKEYLEKLGYNK